MNEQSIHLYQKREADLEVKGWAVYGSAGRYLCTAFYTPGDLASKQLGGYITVDHRNNRIDLHQSVPDYLGEVSEAAMVLSPLAQLNNSLKGR